MMFSREPPLHLGRQRRGELSPLPPSPPQPQDLSTPTSPISLTGMDCPSPLIKRESMTSPNMKNEVNIRFSPSPGMKLEPMSPGIKLESMSPQTPFGSSSMYSAMGGYRGGMEWQPSPCSGDSLPPYSPLSNGGVANFTAVSSPMTSPLSPSSTATLSPSTKSGHEELSPAPSITIDCDRKSKKVSSRQSEELCLVCGDRSSGYHYNALTCEGCKGFFRRSITKKSVYFCKFGKSCEIDMYMRRKCQECRFKKCLAVGMREECVTQTPDSTPSTGVVPEEACKVKRDQKKARAKEQKKDIPHVLESPLQGNRSLDLPSARQQTTLTRWDQDGINKLVYYQEMYESPNEDNIMQAKEYCSKADNPSSTRYREITEMTKYTIELIVQFSKCIPGFGSLQKDDQVTLIKACTPEIMILRASRKYHEHTDSIVFADNTPHTRQFYDNADQVPGTTEALFNFCRRMATMKVDNAEYALLKVVSVFSERPQLVEPMRAESLQFAYVQTLNRYVNTKWAPHQGTRFAKLLNVLTQLRTLGAMMFEQCQHLLDKDMDFPELLAEIMDIKR